MYHSGLTGGGATPSILSNVKVLGWRANGDGIHVFGRWRVEHQFLRTQDDSCYLHSGAHSTYSHVTTWNDANGAAFIMVGANGATLVDSDALYQRTTWYWWDGGRIFTHRAAPGRAGFTEPAANIHVNRFTFLDPFPSMNVFQLVAMNKELKDDASFNGTASSIAALQNMSFTNITVAAVSTARTCHFNWGCNCAPACKKGVPMPTGLPNVLRGTGTPAMVMHYFD